MRAALWVVMLVACNDVHGVAVLVHPNNPDVRWVRLFMGAGDSATANLTPDSHITAGSASYWVRDAGNACDTCDVVSATGEVVKFGFVTESALPVVIAVGYDAQKQPIVAGLAHDLQPSDQSNDFFGYDLDLAPFQPFLANSSAALQLDLWSPPGVVIDPFDAQCAGIIDANADHPYFVVREQDEDCDGFIDNTANECTPDTYVGTAPADPADATCLVSDAVGCRLGGVGCMDGGIAPPCSPIPTCLPTTLCGQCMNKYACAAEILSSGTVNPSLVPHYACTVQLATDGSTCTAPLYLERPPTGGYDCTGIQIADATMQLADKIDQNGVTITASEHVDPMTSCAGQLDFEGVPTSAGISLSAMVDFTLKNNAGVAMPVTIQFQPGGCNQTTTCILDTRAFDDTTQTACASAWTGPSAAVELPTGSIEASDPTLTPDQKQMFYESGGNVLQVVKVNGIWTSTTMAPLTSNTANHAPELSGNGLSIVLTSTDVAAMTNLYISTRANLTGVFGMATPVANLDPQIVFSAATFAPNDMMGNPHMIAAGVSGTDPASVLYDLQLDPTLHAIAMESAITINVVGLAGLDHPHLTPDGLHLYFDGVVNNKRSIWVASRRTIAEPFREAAEVLELDDPQDPINDTEGAWVSGGARVMYYTHAVAGMKHIYQTSRN